MKLTGEDTLMAMIKLVKLPEPVREYRFHDKRRWRFDFAYPDKQIAIEVEGGVFKQGRHTRGTGYTKDCEKYNAAAENGWRVFRYTTAQVNQGLAIEQLKRVLQGHLPPNGRQ